MALDTIEGFWWNFSKSNLVNLVLNLFSKIKSDNRSIKTLKQFYKKNPIKDHSSMTWNKISNNKEIESFRGDNLWQLWKWKMLNNKNPKSNSSSWCSPQAQPTPLDASPIPLNALFKTPTSYYRMVQGKTRNYLTTTSVCLKFLGEKRELKIH